jgi:hypothetical protein
MGIVLPLKGAQIDTLLPAGRFKVAVLYDLPYIAMCNGVSDMP